MTTYSAKTLKQPVAFAKKNASNRRTSLPVLEYMKLFDLDGSLAIQATDLEIGITVRLKGVPPPPQPFLMPSNLFSEILGKVNGSGNISLEFIERTCKVEMQADGITANIPSLAVEEFPPFAYFQTSDQPTAMLRIPAFQLVNGLKNTLPASSQDDARPILGTVHLRTTTKPSALIFESADGFRAHTDAIPFDSGGVNFNAAIPWKSVQTILNLLGSMAFDDEIITLATSTTGNLLVHTDTADLYISLVDGNFPDLEQLFPPKRTPYVVQMSSEELEKAVSFLALFNASTKILRIHLDPSTTEVMLDARSEATGLATRVISADYTAGKATEKITIAVNYRYFAEACKIAGSQHKSGMVEIWFTSPTSPMLAKPVTTDELRAVQGFRGLVMPLHMSEEETENTEGVQPAPESNEETEAQPE